jgi:hypothetical protein
VLLSTLDYRTVKHQNNKVGMKPFRKQTSALGVNKLKIVLPKKILSMTSNLVSLSKNKKNNSYLRLFDLACKNFQIWKEEQRQQRIEKHLHKNVAS